MNCKKWQKSLLKTPDKKGDKRRNVQNKRGGCVRLWVVLPEDMYPETDEHRNDDASALHAVLQVFQVHERFQSHSEGRDEDARHNDPRVRPIGSGR